MTEGQSVIGVALVTGATSGIGRALALELAGRGWALVLVARDRDRLATTAAEARGAGAASTEVIAADLVDPAQLAWIADRLTARGGRVDVLVNAAGMGNAHGFPSAALDLEMQQLDLNVRATMVLAHAAAEAMGERGNGRILNVGSTAGIWSRGTYAGSKAWVHAMTYGLDAASRPKGVTVTLLIPGFTRTEFHARSRTLTGGVPDWLWLDARAVAREGIDALLAGRPVCVPGRQYKALIALASRLSPPSRHALLGRLARLAPAD